MADHRFSLPAATARFAAWWQGERLDRPPVTLRVKPETPPQARQARHASLRERWLDVEFQVETARARLEAQTFLGDSLPMWMPNVGPDLVATLYRAELEFGENTSWCRHTIADVADWEGFVATPPDFANPYWQAIEAMTALAAERFAGRFFVGLPDLHGNFDILTGLRGPENLCLDLVDEPALVRRAVRHAVEGFRESFRRCYARSVELGQPCTTWAPFVHSGPAYVPSCDFWCLVSTEVAKETILPEIVLEMEGLERSLFHLDGPQALRHLDLILGLPQLSAVQWVYGAGKEPARQWLDVYRRIRAAGKAVQVLAEDAGDALAVLREIGPDGVWLTVGREFEHVDAAVSFLHEVERLSRSRS